MAENFCESIRKMKRTKILENRQRGTMESIPRDILLDILSRLPITSLMHVKLVCRSWFNIVSQDSILANIHYTRMAKNDPCLILHCDFPIQNQLYSVDFSLQTVKRIRVPAMMPEFDVVGSCNGLLCICDSLLKNTIYMYNPFTKDHTKLPEPAEQHLKQKQVSIGFGFHPATKEYKVVRIVYYEEANIAPLLHYSLPLQSSVEILSLGSPTWRSIGEILPIQLNPRPKQVLVNGRLHWMSLRGRNQVPQKLVSFDLGDEQFKEVPQPAGCVRFGRAKSHLVNIGGCLAAVVYQGGMRLQIWIMKEYGVKESWTKEFNIGRYLPKGLHLDPSFKFSKIYNNRIRARVLCLLKNGEILLEYRCRVLVSYDPISGTFKELKFQGMPNWFETIAHIGSLNWIDTLIS